MISKRKEIRQIIKEDMQNNNLESLNKRFREEMKLQVVKKITNDENRKKKENKQQERRDKGKTMEQICIILFLYQLSIYINLIFYRIGGIINTSNLTIEDDFFESEEEDYDGKR